MHKIMSKQFELDDFSHEHLSFYAMQSLTDLVNLLNFFRNEWLENQKKETWWQVIQLLPSSYNQRRTVQLNYENLNNMYHSRKNHKLDEWLDFCKWIETLPYAEELIINEN